MNKTGIVMKVENSKACVMTGDGQFVNVSVKGELPSIGQIYTGKTAISLFSPKRIMAAAAVLLIVITSSLSYAYNAEAASIVFDADPQIRLVVNRWNRIINVEALNDNGKKVLFLINIKNEPLNTGLDNIVDEAKKENLLNNSNDSTNNQENINIVVDNNEGKIASDLSEFKNQMKENNLNVVVESQANKKSGNYYKQNNDKNNKGETNNGNQGTEVINQNDNNVLDKSNNNGNIDNTKKNGNGSVKAAPVNKTAQDKNDSTKAAVSQDNNINSDNKKNGKSDNNKDKSKGNGESKREGTDKGNH